MESDNRLKMLFDYTKFHIGLYATLTSLLLALAKLEGKNIEPIQLILLRITVGFFLAAGACGGAVASNIPEYESYAKFAQAELKVFFWDTKTYRTWVGFEHGFFWIGICISVVGFLFF